MRLRDGDTVWWDHRFWGDLIDAPAVVGSWPAPYALAGGRGPEVSADPPLAAALGEAGARLVTGDAAWRVRVGHQRRPGAPRPGLARARWPTRTPPG